MVKDVKLFVDDAVLFPVVDDTDIIRRQKWANQSKMSFDFDRTKPAYGFKFSRKTKNIICPNLYFNNVPIVKETYQKHLGLSAHKLTSYLRLTLVLCEIAHNRKSIISYFQEFSASINKTFILERRLGTGVSF